VVQPQPKIETPKEQIKDVIKDETETKVNVDSLQAIQGKLINQNNRIATNLMNEQDKALLLQQENDVLRAKLAAGELTDNINENAEKMKANSKQKDSLCSISIGNLNRQITLKSQVIKEKDNLYQKTRLNFDTAMVSISTLQKHIQATKPRNQLYAGVMFTGNNAELVSGFGVQVGIKFKNGTIISGMALQMGAITQYGLGISKIISFRK
jgi:uncharacterized protein (DUF3084 family)